MAAPPINRTSKPVLGAAGLPPSPPSHPPLTSFTGNPSPFARLPPPTQMSSPLKGETETDSKNPPQQTGIFSAVNVVRGEMLDIVDDAGQYRDYVKVNLNFR
jgi:hypothetical protein